MICCPLKAVIPRLFATLERAGLSVVGKRYPATLDELVYTSEYHSFAAIQEVGYPGGATIPWTADELVIGDLAE